MKHHITKTRGVGHAINNYINHQCLEKSTRISVGEGCASYIVVLITGIIYCHPTLVVIMSVSIKKLVGIRTYVG